jgi:hypothetical protein
MEDVINDAFAGAKKAGEPKCQDSDLGSNVYG